MLKVLITDYHWPSLDIERRVLAEVGAELIVAETGDEAELIALAPQADAILFCWKPVTNAVLDAAPKCRIASRYGVGLDNINVDYATQLGIPVTYVPDYCMEEVSDHAMALLLACARSIPTFDRDTQQRQWHLQAGRPMFRLRGQTLGIIGYGRIGRTMAPKARGFGMQILVYAPSLAPGDHDGVTVTHDLSALLREADFVSLHAPLNDTTQHIVNADFLAQMKPTAYLINTARGGLIDEEALVVLVELLTPSMERFYCEKRQLIQTFALKYTKLSAREIARRTNRRNHATVLNAQRVINNLVATDTTFAQDYNEIENKIKYHIIND